MKLKLKFSIISDVSDSYENEILRLMVNRSIKKNKKIYGPVSLLPAIGLEFIQAKNIAITKGSTLSKSDFPKVAHFVIMYLAGCYEDEDLKPTDGSNEVHYKLYFESVDPYTFKFAYHKSDN